MAMKLLLLSLQSCNLTTPKSSLLANNYTYSRKRNFRFVHVSALSSSPLPAGDSSSGEDVLRMFLRERQLNGDFISRVSDMLWRRNDLYDLDPAGTCEAQEGSRQHEVVVEKTMSSGVLNLARDGDWDSGESIVPLRSKSSAKDWQIESDKRKELSLLRYEAIKSELLILTTGIGAGCTAYCLLSFSLEAAISYATGVLFSCLYLRLLYDHADNLSNESVPEIFMKKRKNTIGIRSEDLEDAIKKSLGGTVVALSSPRLVIPAAIYGLWALSDHFQNDFFNFELVPGMMGFFAYKAAALVQVYRDNVDLLMIFPEDEGL